MTETNRGVVNHADSLAKPIQDSLPTTYDTTIMIFKNTSYKLSLHVFDTETFNEEKNNSTISFNRIQRDKIERIFQDSFYCMSSLMDFQDFNNDGIKNVLFFYYTGARANPTYHLYLVDTNHHRLTYVKGFEDLPNPELDSTNNIISSSALSGGNVGVSFYRINSKSKLINLGHSFDAEFGDDEPFDRAKRKIINEKGN